MDQHQRERIARALLGFVGWLNNLENGVGILPAAQLGKTESGALEGHPNVFTDYMPNNTIGRNEATAAARQLSTKPLPYRYDTAERTMRNMLGDLRILAGDEVGPSGATWRNVAGTAILNLRSLARQIETAAFSDEAAVEVPVFPTPDEVQTREVGCTCGRATDVEATGTPCAYCAHGVERCELHGHEGCSDERCRDR